MRIFGEPIPDKRIGVACVVVNVLLAEVPVLLNDLENDLTMLLVINNLCKGGLVCDTLVLPVNDPPEALRALGTIDPDTLAANSFGFIDDVDAEDLNTEVESWFWLWC